MMYVKVIVTVILSNVGSKKTHLVLRLYYTSKACEHDVKICIYAIKTGSGIKETIVTARPILAYDQDLESYPNIVASGVSDPSLA